MFHPLPLYIGLRYVRSRGKGFFVSFISWTSMLGICLGVAALITIISVMNGLEAEYSGRLLSATTHAKVSAPSRAGAGHPRLTEWRSVAKRAGREEGVVGVAPYLDLQGMLGRGEELRPALIRGIDPELEGQVSNVAAHMVQGTLTDLKPGTQHIALGSNLAWALEAQLGDEITILVPTVAASGEGVVGGIDLVPRIRTFILSGIFEFGALELDSTLALIHLADAAAVADTDGAPAGLRLKFQDVYAAPARIGEIAEKLGGDLETNDWSRENASYYRAITIEKTMMAIILMLAVTVAAFNIAAALVMVVNEKRTDIAILRTIGLTPRAVVGVFITQGMLIGWVGALSGFALGLALAFNVETLAPMIERTLGVHFFDPTVYYISEVPSEVRWPQVMTITIIALILTVAATIYPALRGAATEPAEALRYE
jgi:lipoprotein-releasing system permease protein